MPSATTDKTTCPNCSAPATGRFCSECGTALADAACSACRSLLSPGARFCHRCGTATGRTPPAAPRRAGEESATSSGLPWAVAAIALLALIALVAGQRFAGSRAAPAVPLGDAPFAGGAPASEVVRAPDISNLSPRERADRLYDRVMRLSAEGKTDSIRFFAPMALSAYQTLGPLDADLRYDYGRVAEAAGAVEVARAQADTILRGDPTHLLGLVLGMRAAQLRGDTAAVRAYSRRLIAAEAAESAKQRSEYQRHQGDILDALAEARRQ
jgi:hypothetical protein